MSEEEWKARAILEAQRSLANGQRAAANETALDYILAKLQAHHTSRPGINAIIARAKELRKVEGGLTPVAGDAAAPYCDCKVPALAPFIECENCGKPPRP